MCVKKSSKDHILIKNSTDEVRFSTDPFLIYMHALLSCRLVASVHAKRMWAVGNVTHARLASTVCLPLTLTDV